jgi:hypothetical protein
MDGQVLCITVRECPLCLRNQSCWLNKAINICYLQKLLQITHLYYSRRMVFSTLVVMNQNKWQKHWNRNWREYEELTNQVHLICLGIYPFSDRGSNDWRHKTELYWLKLQPKNVVLPYEIRPWHITKSCHSSLSPKGSSPM